MSIDTGLAEMGPKTGEALDTANASEILDKTQGKRSWRRTAGKLLKYGLIAGGVGLGLLAFGPAALGAIGAIHGISASAATAVASYGSLLTTTGEIATAAGLSTAAVAGVGKAFTA